MRKTGWKRHEQRWVGLIGSGPARRVARFPIGTGEQLLDGGHQLGDNVALHHHGIRARGKGRIKRGGDWRRVDLEDRDLAVTAPPDLLLTLDDALTRLDSEDAAAASLVRLRYFAGLSTEEPARSLGISTATAYRHWAYARAWLFDALRPDKPLASQ